MNVSSYVRELSLTTSFFWIYISEGKSLLPSRAFSLRFRTAQGSHLKLTYCPKEHFYKYIAQRNQEVTESKADAEIILFSTIT